MIPDRYCTGRQKLRSFFVVDWWHKECARAKVEEGSTFAQSRSSMALHEIVVSPIPNSVNLEGGICGKYSNLQFSLRSWTTLPSSLAIHFTLQISISSREGVGEHAQCMTDERSF